MVTSENTPFLTTVTLPNSFEPGDGKQVVGFGEGRTISQSQSECCLSVLAQLLITEAQRRSVHERVALLAKTFRDGSDSLLRIRAVARVAAGVIAPAVAHPDSWEAAASGQTESHSSNRGSASGDRWSASGDQWSASGDRLRSGSGGGTISCDDPWVAAGSDRLVAAVGGGGDRWLPV